jgi:hypothetical protein
MSGTKTAAEEAMGLICGPRMAFYGPPWENLASIGTVWTEYAKIALEDHGELNVTDVSMLMVLLKVMRQARGYHRDSTVDIIGYAALAEVTNDAVAREVFIMRAANQIEDHDERVAFLKQFGCQGGE